MNTEIEIFANIVGFPNYQVSNHGNVKNVKTGRILKPTINCGYLKVALRNDGDISNKQLHRLVAITFLENPDNKPCVDHINRNPLNNHISNLRWATPTENQQNASIRIDNASGTTGVFFNKSNQKWQAQITADGRKIHLGSFEDKNDAIFARTEAEIRFFGEFRSTA